MMRPHWSGKASSLVIGVLMKGDPDMHREMAAWRWSRDWTMHLLDEEPEMASNTQKPGERPGTEAWDDSLCLRRNPPC